MVELLSPDWDDTVEEIHRLENKATRARSIDLAREYEREADDLSRHIAHYLRTKYPNNFHVHFVDLTDDQFSFLDSPLSWTTKSFVRVPRRRQIIDHIRNTHQLESYDIIIVTNRRGPVSYYSTIFVTDNDLEGSITSNYLIVPKSLSKLMHNLGLTDLAAQELYFGSDPNAWRAWLFVKPYQMEDKDISGEEESVKIK